MELIYLLVAVLFVGHIKLYDVSAEAQRALPTVFPGGILSSLPGQGGLASGILNAFQGGNQNSLFANLQGGFLEYPGSLVINPNNKEAVEELKRQCIAHANESVYNEVELAGNNMQKCIFSAIPTMQSLLGGNQVELCKSMRTRFLECMTDFHAKLELCLDKTSAYIPGHNMQVYDSIFNFLCNQEADHATTLVMSVFEPNGCLQKVQGVSRECLLKTENFSETHVALFRNITKPELCSDTAIWRDCVIENAKTHCTLDKLDFVSGMARAVYEPCSASTLCISNTFMLCLFFFFTKLF